MGIDLYSVFHFIFNLFVQFGNYCNQVLFSSINIFDFNIRVIDILGFAFPTLIIIFIVARFIRG